MKILHIITSMHTGGAEKFCVDLCNNQVKNTDHEVYLCVLDKITEQQTLVTTLSPNVHLISLDKDGGYSIKMIFKIYTLIQKVKPDIIHLNGRALIYSSIPIVLKGIPSVYTVHTMAHKEHNKILRKYIKFLFNYMPSLFTPIAISKSVNETIQKTYGSQYNKIIYNGSSKLELTNAHKDVLSFINKNKINEKTKVFLYIGRIQQAKNTLLLIDTFNQLIDMNKNICLLIIGYDPVPNQQYLHECISRNKFPNRIKFLGKKENIADYLSYVDALCLTSSYEGLGIAALEAFSMGIPVLSTPSGGPSDIIISGFNGYVSEKITVDSYAEIINKFIKYPIKNKEKIVTLYNEKYTMDKCAKMYLELYKMKAIKK